MEGVCRFVSPYMRYNASPAKRTRNVKKNMVVVQRLRDFFPDNRDSLTKAGAPAHVDSP